jgi:hypothetical protein
VEDLYNEYKNRQYDLMEITNLNKELRKMSEIIEKFSMVLDNLSTAVGNLPACTRGEELNNAWDAAEELLGRRPI